MPDAGTNISSTKATISQSQKVSFANRSSPNTRLQTAGQQLLLVDA
jgi:hypothetical protein